MNTLLNDEDLLNTKYPLTSLSSSIVLRLLLCILLALKAAWMTREVNCLLYKQMLNLIKNIFLTSVIMLTIPKCTLHIYDVCKSMFVNF